MVNKMVNNKKRKTKLAIGDRIRFKAFNVISGEWFEVIGYVEGLAEDIRRLNPEEYGEVTDDCYLVVDARARHDSYFKDQRYLVNIDEILEIQTHKGNQTITRVRKKGGKHE